MADNNRPHLFEVLTIETTCNKCNVTISGKKVSLRCPRCNEVIDTLRVFKEVS